LCLLQPYSFSQELQMQYFDTSKLGYQE